MDNYANFYILHIYILHNAATIDDIQMRITLRSDPKKKKNCAWAILIKHVMKHHQHLTSFADNKIPLKTK